MFRAGPDYATDVLQDPWDFSNVEDVGQYPHDYAGWAQSPTAFSNGPSAFGLSGRFIATNASNDPGIGLLYPGGIGTPNPGRSGQRYSISTTLYRKLSFRLKATGAGGSGSEVRWYLGGLGSPLGIANGPPVTNVERIYQIDLVADYHGDGSAYTSQPQMAGLRLDPINDASPAEIELDWVRLTAPDGGANDFWMMLVNASNCTGSPAVSVSDGVTTTEVLSAGPLGRRFNYGIFPPGTYTLTIGCGNGNATQQFVINDPPQVTVLQPDERGGADYATTVRGDAWDMDQLTDVVLAGNLDQGGVVAAPGSGSMIRGRNVLSANPSITGDPNLFLLYAEGASRPIASSRYRYLTFTTQLHHAFDLGAGSIARVGWASAPNWSDITANGTDDILIWPGRNTYTIDLGALSAGNGLEPSCAPPNPCLPWMQASPRFLRFDPHEFGFQQVVFDLDNVTLAAPDEVVQGDNFLLQWNTLGMTAGSINVSYDTDRNPGGGTLIASLPFNATSYNWPVGALAPGDYYIFIEANETLPPGSGSDYRAAYSTGVLRVLPAANSPVLTITPASGGSAHAPFSIAGCAYAGTTGAAASEVIVYAHPRAGQMGGVVQILGHNAPGGLGTLTAETCSTGGPGYQVSNIFGLAAGPWDFRVLARNTLDGDFDEVQAQNVTIGLTAAPARNLRLTSAVGNTVAVAWDPPVQGTLTQYRLEIASEPSFTPYSHLAVGPETTALSGALGNGTYFVRVRTGNTYTSEGPTSNVLSFTLPFVPGSGDPPGQPTLNAAQVVTNPITLTWSPGSGGAPAQYFLLAGSAPGASNYGTFPMGLATSVTAVAPAGPVYARLVAINPSGQAVSNEIGFALAPPSTPTMNPASVSGNNVVLSWTPAAGATSYVCVVRYPGQPAVILTMPWTGTTLAVPGAPPGTYVVTVVAVNSIGYSAESNPVTVAVQ